MSLLSASCLVWLYELITRRGLFLFSIFSFLCQFLSFPLLILKDLNLLSAYLFNLLTLTILILYDWTFDLIRLRSGFLMIGSQSNFEFSLKISFSARNFLWRRSLRDTFSLPRYESGPSQASTGPTNVGGLDGCSVSIHSALSYFSELPQQFGKKRKKNIYLITYIYYAIHWKYSSKNC